MFKIAVNETYVTPVDVEVPDGTGKSNKHSFKARFKRLKQSEIDSVYRRIGKENLLEGEEQLTDDELLKEVMTGWEGVQDLDGGELEFNEENMARLLDIFPTRSTLVKAYFGSIKTSARKN